ncbi:MAG: hypothetical protein ACO1RX_15085 [Candidatus Sericytochromatia bacterium]
MNLKELVHAQSQLLQHRHSEADLLCQRAYYLIAEAEAGDFANKALLKQALQLFIQAVRQQRRAPEPYIGLAYLAILLEQRDQARRYLQTALGLNPQQSDAAQLLSYLEDTPPSASGIPTFAEVAFSDLDRLHEHIEQQLYDFVRTLMQQAPPEISFEAEAIRALRQTSTALQNQIQSFESRIVLLEGEFDTADLRRRLRPADAIFKRYQRALDSSESQMLIHEEIIRLIERVRSLFGQSETQPLSPARERELESLMDRCDWLADRLDELAAEERLETLEYRYHALIEMIEQVREKLDDDTGS